MAAAALSDILEDLSNDHLPAFARSRLRLKAKAHKHMLTGVDDGRLHMPSPKSSSSSTSSSGERGVTDNRISVNMRQR